MDNTGLLGDSDFTTILVSVGCLVLLIIVIHVISSRMDFERSHRTVDFGPQQRSMIKVTNPFVLDLDGDTKVLSDGAKLQLSSLCACHMVVVWGCNIQELHKLMLEPGRLIRARILASLSQCTDLDPLHYDAVEFSNSGKHTVNLPCPANVTSEKLGEIPRKKYPLCVFLFTKEIIELADKSGEECKHTQENEIIGLFTTIHLKDSIVNKDSHIIGKYVKTYGIPIYSLQTLFTPTADLQSGDANKAHSNPPEDDSQHSYSFSTSISSTTLHANVFAEREMSECDSDHNHLESFDYVAGLAPETPKVYTDCVVCQANAAKCVILPCRHNCVCLQCLLNLNKCPMCRSVLESYFIVGKDDSREQRDEEEREQAQVIRQGIAAQVENVFESINNWVGFT